MHSIQSLVIASSNTGKIAEFNRLLSPIHCISQQDLKIPDVEETGVTFVENALLKARNASCLSGLPALADDSGLVVEALDGAPGIFSARFAGFHATDLDNIHYLLKSMEHLPNESRKAFFYCTIVLINHPNDPTPLIATGILSGTILRKAKGTQGFGYDPVFYIPEQQQTLAQLSLSEKNKISHRARATAQLLNELHLRQHV